MVSVSVIVCRLFGRGVVMTPRPKGSASQERADLQETLPVLLPLQPIALSEPEAAVLM